MNSLLNNILNDDKFKLKEKKINLLFKNINNKNIEFKNTNKSQEVICPKCGEYTRINIKDYKITLFYCKNKHEINNILLDKYENTQKNGESKIICNKCNNQKNNINDNSFYKCYTCLINLCQTYILNHDNNHNIINYEKSKYICEIHKQYFISYCNICKINLCILCEDTHHNHVITKYNSIIPNLSVKKGELEELRKKLIFFDVIINNEIEKIKRGIDDFNNGIKIKIYEFNEDIGKNEKCLIMRLK